MENGGKVYDSGFRSWIGNHFQTDGIIWVEAKYNGVFLEKKWERNDISECIARMTNRPQLTNMSTQTGEYIWRLSSSELRVLFWLFLLSFFTFFRWDDGFQRRSKESFPELRQPRKERCYGAGTRQQELDEDGQRLRTLQQDLHFHRRWHHLPEVLRQQGQAHQLRRFPQVHRRAGPEILQRFVF